MIPKVEGLDAATLDYYVPGPGANELSLPVGSLGSGPKPSHFGGLPGPGCPGSGRAQRPGRRPPLRHRGLFAMPPEALPCLSALPERSFLTLNP